MTAYPRRDIPARVVARVLSRITVHEDCLLSTYGQVTPAGYRGVSWSERGESCKGLVHRVAWIARHGEIPVDMTVHHVCFRTNCVNADHLELMPNFENTRRKGGEDWPLGACKRGHSNSEMATEGKQRVCKPCRKASVDRRRAARREERECSPLLVH